MRLLFIAIALVALSVSVDAKSLPRTPVTETPVLGGRRVERFVLESWIVGAPERGHRPGTVVYNLKIPPNIFEPTIQDARGVFFQAANGLFSGSMLVPGGLYVSKSKPDEIFLFFGNARGTGLHVVVGKHPLQRQHVSKLRIAKVQR